MLDLQQKRKFRGLMYNKWTIGVLFVLVILIIHSTWGVYMKKKESENMKSISLQTVSDLRNRDQRLKTSLDRLDTPEGVEEEIRSKFSVAKENENVAIIVPESPNKNLAGAGETNFWQKFVNFLFGSK